jgi:hypothetical protein
VLEKLRLLVFGAKAFELSISVPLRKISSVRVPVTSGCLGVLAQSSTEADNGAVLASDQLK